MIDSLNFDISGTPCLLFHAWLLLIFDIGGTPCLLFHACRLIILRPAVPCDSYFMHVAYYIWGQRHSMTLISCMSLIWYSRVHENKSSTYPSGYWILIGWKHQCIYGYIGPWPHVLKTQVNHLWKFFVVQFGVSGIIRISNLGPPEKKTIIHSIFIILG